MFVIKNLRESSSLSKPRLRGVIMTINTTAPLWGIQKALLVVDLIFKIVQQ